MLRLRPARTGLDSVTTFLLSVAQILVWGGSYFLLAVFAGPITRDTGWSLAWVQGALSAALMIAAMVSPLVGRLLDRFGGRLVLSASSIFTSTGLLIVAASETVAAYIAGWLVIGLGMGIGLYDPLFAALAQVAGRQTRAAITRITLISGLATTATWPVSAYLIAVAGWRHAAVILALIIGLGATSIYVLRFPANQADPIEETSKAPKPDNISRSGVLFVLITIFALAAMIMTTISTQLPELLRDIGHRGNTAIWLAALLGPAQVAARLFEMGRGSRLHPAWSNLLSAVLVTIGLCILAGSSKASALAVAIYGMGSGLRSIVRGTLPLAVFGDTRYPRIAGIIAAPCLVVQALTPAAMGYARSIGGADAIFLLLIASALAGWALSAWLVFQLKPNDRNRQDRGDPTC